jgi:hypothetical protein
MTSTGITAPGLSGVMRMTWLHDELAHVLEHADVDEPPGTIWLGMWRSRTGARGELRRVARAWDGRTYVDYLHAG